jgi:hypothetical protein
LRRGCKKFTQQKLQLWKIAKTKVRKLHISFLGLLMTFTGDFLHSFKKKWWCKLWLGTFSHHRESNFNSFSSKNLKKTFSHPAKANLYFKHH